MSLIPVAPFAEGFRLRGDRDLSGREEFAIARTRSPARETRDEFNKIGDRGPLGRLRASHNDAATRPLRLRLAADD